MGSLGSYLTAIDYKTGKIAWRHKYPGNGGGGMNGMLTTAGKLLFAGDLGGNIVAYDPANGKILWHSHDWARFRTRRRLTCWMGINMLLVAAGDTLYSFMLY